MNMFIISNCKILSTEDGESGAPGFAQQSVVRPKL